MTASEARIIQMTDLRLTEKNELLYDRIDTWQRLSTALSAASHFNPDAVLVTGDIYNSDAPASSEFNALIDKASQELGCTVLVVPGNHDDPKTNIFATGQALAAGPEPGDQVYRIEDMRVLTINTHGQGAIQGHVTDAQLEWLGAELQTAAPSGSLLAMHHPPTPTTHEFLSTVGLTHPDRLAAVLKATDVRLIISGHLHFPTVSMLGTIPVWSGPALAYQQNAFAPAGTLQGIDAPGISVIDFFADTHAIAPVLLDIPTALFSRPIPNSPDSHTSQLPRRTRWNVLPRRRYHLR